MTSETNEKTTSQKSPKRASKFQKVVASILWLFFTAGVVAVFLIFAAISTGRIGYMPSIEELENPKNKSASLIYTDDGEELGRYFISSENRISVNYSDLSPHLVNALIATEDSRFTEHSGIDARALFRAIIKRGILMQKSAGGGSTITQQLAKQLYSPQAENLFERMLQKPIEWVIAIKLERFYTKEEIINMYLNKFDFLYNAVGIRSAAQVYFNTTPAELTIEQAATLVGMCKNPAYFNPITRSERTLGRRNTVLGLMLRDGFITQAQHDQALQKPLGAELNRIDHKAGRAPYLREHLRLMLTAEKPLPENYRGWQRQEFVDDSIAWNTNPLYGWCNKNRKADGSKYNIYTDGLKIYTTLDSRMQQYAEEAVQEHVVEYLQPAFMKEKAGRSYAPFSRHITAEERESILRKAMEQSDRYRTMKGAGFSVEEIHKAFETPRKMTLYANGHRVDTLLTPMDSIRYRKSFLRTGFISMDPFTGYVKAYVGGTDFANFQYDMASKGRRQVGSTIKPFLYTLAMEEGFSPCDLAPNSQPHILDESGRMWEPRNSSNKRLDEMVTLSWGLANSNNWISAYLIDKLSPHNFVRLLRTFGIKSQLDPVKSLCLGPADVSVEEMVSAYTAFSNTGQRVDPLYVSRIEDSYGNIISEFTPNVTEVFSEEAYYKMLPILQDVVNKGTGIRMRYKYKVTAPMGGKTGTTNNNSDAWFMAFTPNLVSGTWVGGEDRSIHFDTMLYGQGASSALPVYALFINKVYVDKTLSEYYNQTIDFEIPKEYRRTPCQEGEGQEGAAQVADPLVIEGMFD